MTAGLEDFPHLHPLVVHFPIVLLVVVALLQVVNVFFHDKSLEWLVTAFIILGFIGAYVSTTWVHPHTHGLTQNAEKVLEFHDTWADRTLYFAGFGMVLQGVVHFRYSYYKWAKIVVLIVLLLSAISVSITGHYGAQLVHIEGVGPQGKFLETEDEHEH